ncbi:hypothetical protein GQ44DRAFT_636509 [Phaeosphaeriaceae sp. PMI808]|nr:hypothetical protein GQ44DRAFT_636509 [Phaeosphaeriaceae sp. PMI808]
MEADSTTSAYVFRTGYEVRLACRRQQFAGQTSGKAPSYLQANLIILPKRYAYEFELFCRRNPVPCPLLAQSATPGNATLLKSHVKAGGAPGPPLRLAEDIDLRRDAPMYRVYSRVDGRVVSEDVEDIAHLWQDDHVGFLLGCSFSFEAALADAGLTPRHVAQGRNVPMYRTTIPLCPAGPFSGTYVVTMRPYKPEAIEKVRDITRPYVETHGEPIAWGWDAVDKLGIKDIASPEWGDNPLSMDGSKPFDDSEGFVPVFWGCGVTPQNAVMTANLDGTVMAHSPGCMFVLDVCDHEVVGQPVV